MLNSTRKTPFPEKAAPHDVWRRRFGIIQPQIALPFALRNAGSIKNGGLALLG